MSFAPRVNVLGEPLQAVKIPGSPLTGFFRNGFCDSTPLDRASHTVAAVVTQEFLQFSASRGNELRPMLASGNGWCLCAARWKEAMDAAAKHQDGDKIVPRVILSASHETALDIVGLDSLRKYATEESNVCELPASKELVGAPGTKGGRQV